MKAEALIFGHNSLSPAGSVDQPNQHPVVLAEPLPITVVAGRLALDIAAIVTTDESEQILAHVARYLVEQLPCEASFFLGFTNMDLVANPPSAGTTKRYE